MRWGGLTKQGVSKQELVVFKMTEGTVNDQAVLTGSSVFVCECKSDVSASCSYMDPLMGFQLAT